MKGSQTTLILVLVLVVVLYMRSKANASTGPRRERPGTPGEAPPPATPAQVKQRVLAPINVLTSPDPFGRNTF